MKSIFLVGPKHSGKTSAGRVLASLWGCDFIDIDELIESRTGKSPRTLYGEGPGIFRKAEAEALAYLLETKNTGRRVIASGGGLVDNGDALALVEKNNTVLPVYLDISANAAWERIEKTSNGELPPFLQTDNPRETHRALHERRAAAYRRVAGIVIDAEEKSPEVIAKEIASLVY